MTGTLINVTAVVAGTAVGTALGHRLPEKMRATIMDGLGLITILIGLQMALETQNVLLVLGSVLVGGILGETAGIQDMLSAFAEKLERLMGRFGKGRFAEGFVAASLLFCVGPMTIMGAIQDGLTGDFSTLAVKSALDGFASIAFAATLGMGVGFSALVILIYQGGITFLASWASASLTDAMIREMTATGGVLIFALGLGLLNLKRVRVANLLPAIFAAPFLVVLAERLQGGF